MNYIYGRYWLKHRQGVAMAGRVLGVSRWRLIKHDMSKLSPDEWFPNAQYWAVPKEQRKQEHFEYLRSTIWPLHYARNDHHAAHWQGAEMSEEAVRELVADWWGAGYVHGGKPDVKRWYLKNGPREDLHPKTRERIEDLIADLDYVQKYMPHLLWRRKPNGTTTTAVASTERGNTNN
jgi:hypothetical protein